MPKRRRVQEDKRCGEPFKKFDVFDERPALTVDGEKSFKTLSGATLSILALLLVLLYGI